jgi:phosphatidylinositol alpha-mannosyltransferase
LTQSTAGLRIGMVSYYLPSGSKIGVGYQVHALANALVARGHSVTVFSACGASEGARYRTEQVPLSGSNRTFKFALALRKADWQRFDVLHAHGDDYWLWRRRAPAHVRTLHGSCLAEARWISGARERTRMVLLGLSEVLATLVADATVGVSQNSLRWTPWVRHVIPNGVDLSVFRPGERAKQPTVLFVGTYGWRKRGALLVDVFQRDVLPEVPGAELWMVSDHAPRLPKVKLLGGVSDQALAELYRRAWVFCLPSKYEGFGIPYVEAMASGCAVVATDNPGAREVTVHGEYGALVDDAALGQTLVRLLTSSEERALLVGRAQQRAAQFDLKNVAASYEALYLHLIARANPSSGHNDIRL